MAFDNMTGNSALLRRKSRSGFKPDRFYPWILVLAFSFLTADLLIVRFRHLMLPTGSAPARSQRFQSFQRIDRSAYSPVNDKNIFAEDGKIPPALVADGQEKAEEEAAPVPSSLPLTLIGTLVHSDPTKSIATIDVKSKNMTMAVRVDKDIPGIARLVKVERTKAIIRNLNNSRLEYIEMKDASKLSFQASRPAASTGSTEIQTVGNNRFEVKRSDVLKYTADMGAVLQQAAMQPRRNANGEIECFKFLAIQPGSIYTQLGFQVGDCLKGVNGEKIDSPAKAMEMYRALQSSNSIKIQMERDGRDQENDYSIK